MLITFSAYMTTTGYLQSDDLMVALPLPLISILLTLVVHVWPQKKANGLLNYEFGSLWPWCLTAYLIAGLPVYILLAKWKQQTEELNSPNQAMHQQPVAGK